MKPDRYPWNHLGAGPEPRLARDFAASVLSRARTERKRIRVRRALAAGAICAGLALGIVILGTRPAANNPPQVTVGAPAEQSITSAPLGELAANEIGAEVPTIAQLAEVQTPTAAAQDEGDVFEEFLPGADDVADFAPSYSANDWITETGWDSNS